MLKIAPKLMLIALACLALNSCQTVDRAYEGTVSMTDPDKVKIQSSLRWINPQPRLRPAEQMTVFCRFKNSSGADVEIYETMRQEIAKSGYTIVNNIKDAKYYLKADLRYLGEKRVAGYGGAATGAVLGGVAGGVIGHQTGGKNDTGIGAVAGAVIGGLAGNIVNKRNKMVTYDLVIDLTLGERIAGGVQTERSVEQDSRLSSSTSSKTSGYQVGTQNSKSHENSVIEVRENFLYHENRAIASATKLKLTIQEASPILRSKIARAVSATLP